MQPVLALTLEGLKVTELAIGSIVGLGLGVAALLLPEGRRLLPPAAALVAAVLVVAFGAGDGWVLLAVGVPATTAAVTTLRRRQSRRTSAALAAAAAVAGTVLLGPAAAAMVRVPRPAVVVAFAAVAALASLAADRRLSPLAVVAMGAWTAFGLFLCDPDTEAASLVGAALTAAAVVASVATWAGWPRNGHARPDADAIDADAIDAERAEPADRVAGSASAMVLLLVWSGAYGAEGREDTIVAGFACLGVLLALPVAASLAALVPVAGGRTERLGGRLLTAVQAPLVVVCSRIGGVRTTPLRAALVGGAALALATAVLAVALGRSRSDGHPLADTRSDGP